jgi:cellulose synthase/poly-beta-1,6-N-acetylglucosamine synthase-like glycosyltransferase
MLSAIIITVIIIYLLVIGILIYGFDKIIDFKLQDLPAKIKFSIIIPFRNEDENLPKLLASIAALNYPQSLFEIILVDDDSEDESVSVIKTFLNTACTNKNFINIIKNKRTTNSPKKDAITSAIAVAKFDWIITTDADCNLPKYWLDTFDECIQTQQPNCIVAPVTYHDTKSFFSRFQILDMLSLQGATIGGFGIRKPFLCNGANFGYRKTEFYNLNGFEGNTDIASGDDMFLLEKFTKHQPNRVIYLKSEKAIVKTNTVESISQLIQQRLRWASKTSESKNWVSKGIGFTIFIANLTCILLLPLLFFNVLSPRIALSLFIIKFSIDFLLLFKTLRFFKQETILQSYLLSSLLYPLFSVYIVLLSLVAPYRWKGRTFKK